MNPFLISSKVSYLHLYMKVFTLSDNNSQIGCPSPNHCAIVALLPSQKQITRCSYPPHPRMRSACHHQVDGWELDPNYWCSHYPLKANILLVAEILHQLRLVVYPIIYKVLYLPGGAGFLPSTVSLKNSWDWKMIPFLIKWSHFIEDIHSFSYG